MTNDQVTIAFEGDDVPLVEFAKAMGHFSGLLEALSQEISPNDKVQWTIYDLQAGSAIATARGLCDSMEVVGSIANAYLGIGKALESGEAINYSSNVQLHVNGILGVLN